MRADYIHGHALYSVDAGVALDLQPSAHTHAAPLFDFVEILHVLALERGHIVPLRVDDRRPVPVFVGTVGRDREFCHLLVIDVLEPHAPHNAEQLDSVDLFHKLIII